MKNTSYDIAVVDFFYYHFFVFLFYFCFFFVIMTSAVQISGSLFLLKTFIQVIMYVIKYILLVFLSIMITAFKLKSL
jgi:hypothetical protein